MASPPNAIYRIVHGDGWRLEETAYNRGDMMRAMNGDEAARKSITMSLRNRIKDAFGRDPGRINFDDLEIRELRALPPPPPSRHRRRPL